METVTGPDGRPLHVARTESLVGSKGPFYVVYADTDRETRWGFYCDNCETLDNAVDPMGRIQCNTCSNIKKADEWDAAHE